MMNRNDGGPPWLVPVILLGMIGWVLLVERISTFMFNYFGG